MKILLVTTVFPSPLQPNKGAFNREMVRALGASHELQVIAPVAWPIAYRARRAGSDVGRRSTPRRHRGSPSRLLLHAQAPAHAVRRVLLVVDPPDGRPRCCESFEPDVVIGYWAHPDGQAAVQVARRLGVPAVVMVGGTDVLVLGHEASRRRAIRRVLEHADAIVTVSQDLKRALQAWELPASKVHVVRRGIDVTRFKPGDSRCRTPAARHRTSAARMLLWVGHMVPVKGLEVLIEACAQAAARTRFSPLPRRRRSLYGKLQRRCVEAGHRRTRVTFVGYVPPRGSARLVSRRRSDGPSEPFGRRSQRAARVDRLRHAVCRLARRRDSGDRRSRSLDRLVAPGDAGALADAIVDSLIGAEPHRSPSDAHSHCHRCRASSCSSVLAVDSQSAADAVPAMTKHRSCSRRATP